MPRELRGVMYVVYGRVQGVGFRYSACSVARRLGLHGWIRNNADGTVEAFAEGDPASIAKFHDWLKQGPPGASVFRVDTRESSVTNAYPGFTIAY